MAERSADDFRGDRIVRRVDGNRCHQIEFDHVPEANSRMRKILTFRNWVVKMASKFVSATADFFKTGIRDLRRKEQCDFLC